jgi:hypothetical protein
MRGAFVERDSPAQAIATAGVMPDFEPILGSAADF